MTARHPAYRRRRANQHREMQQKHHALLLVGHCPDAAARTSSGKNSAHIAKRLTMPIAMPEMDMQSCKNRAVRGAER